jgi:hypothetical protein
MQQRDSHILLHYTTYNDTAARPGFDIRRKLSANIPYRTRETTHSPHIYITHGIRLQRRRPTLQPVRRLTPHRTRTISHIYQRRLTYNYTYSLRAQNYIIRRRQTNRRQCLEILCSEVSSLCSSQLHQARTARRNRPLRFGHIWVTHVQDLSQRTIQDMAQ